MAMFFEVLLRMTQAYYFPKQNVDFEKLSDVTKDILFNELKKEKYSNIFKPFLNKIKNEFLHAFKNIPDIEIDIPNDNLYVLNYENNKFNFSIAKGCYSKVKSSFFYNELLAQLSSQSPFKFFSQKDLETGLSNSYSFPLFQPYSKNSVIVNNRNDIDIIIKTPLLNNICNTVIKSDSLCTFFEYDKSSNNLNLLKSNIVQYIKDKARNISLNKINVIENSLQENISKETLDYINKNISLTFNDIMLNIIDYNNHPYDSETYGANTPDVIYNRVYDDLCKKVKSTSSNDDNIIYVYEQNVNEFISSDYLGCKTSTEFINEWCDNLQLPLKVSRIFPNIVIDENDKSNTKVFPTCQDAQDFMLDYLEPWLDEHNKIQDRDPDRLYEKAKQYLELSSNLNEKTLPDLEQSFNKIKGFSTNQTQLKDAKNSKSNSFHR